METNYKRQYRQMDDTTKQKISQALRGRTKSATHVQSISDGLKVSSINSIYPLVSDSRTL